MSPVRSLMFPVADRMPIENNTNAAAVGLLAIMFFLAGGAALRESPATDEVAHVGAGLS